MRFQLLLIFAVLLSSLHLHAQIVTDDEDSERKLYASTKQVNQFFRRFNGEESEKGDRFYPRDKQYRNVKLRKKYMSILFDSDNAGIKPDLKTQFVNDILEQEHPPVLDFHGGNWFAEVQGVFTMGGKNQTVTMFMALEDDHLGSKWVITKVHADMFSPYFDRDTVHIGRFLHPMSHELDFMNLRKAFVRSDSVSQFASKQFVPDHLSLFLYEIKKGNLKFKSVESVKFHFFQIPGWYFELSQFNRAGYNTGWLISNLVKLNNTNEKDLLTRYLYYETR
jgi:hypothetical protein